jgi:molybdopterin converting factor small subunit
MEYYKFNVNGLFYFDGMDFGLHSGDRIALLMPVTGG